MMDQTPRLALKGDTKFFFEHGTADILFEMVLALGSEMSAMMTKLDMVVEYLSERGLVLPDALQEFGAREEQQSRQEMLRQRLVQALLAPYQAQADALVERAAAKSSAHGA
jgi:hypothetical protein